MSATAIPADASAQGVALPVTKPGAEGGAHPEKPAPVSTAPPKDDCCLPRQDYDREKPPCCVPADCSCNYAVQSQRLSHYRRELIGSRVVWGGATALQNYLFTLFRDIPLFLYCNSHICYVTGENRCLSGAFCMMCRCCHKGRPRLGAGLMDIDIAVQGFKQLGAAIARGVLTTILAGAGGSIGVSIGASLVTMLIWKGLVGPYVCACAANWSERKKYWVTMSFALVIFVLAIIIPSSSTGSGGGDSGDGDSSSSGSSGTDDGSSSGLSDDGSGSDSGSDSTSSDTSGDQIWGALFDAVVSPFISVSLSFVVGSFTAKGADEKLRKVNNEVPSFDTLRRLYDADSVAEFAALDHEAKRGIPQDFPMAYFGGKGPEVGSDPVQIDFSSTVPPPNEEDLARSAATAAALGGTGADTAPITPMPASVAVGDIESGSSGEGSGSGASSASGAHAAEVAATLTEVRAARDEARELLSSSRAVLATAEATKATTEANTAVVFRATGATPPPGVSLGTASGAGAAGGGGVAEAPIAALPPTPKAATPPGAAKEEVSAELEATLAEMRAGREQLRALVAEAQELVASIKAAKGTADTHSQAIVRIAAALSAKKKAGGGASTPK